jgi:hypothetical protein
MGKVLTYGRTTGYTKGVMPLFGAKNQTLIIIRKSRRSLKIMVGDGKSS